MTNNVDCLAFGAHPDDVELFCGGTLVKLKRLGYTTAVCDLTRGELSTNGDLPTRRRETDKASELLGLDKRVNLEIADGNISMTPENRDLVIRLIRELRPQVVLAPYWEDRHPDHIAAAQLVKNALFYSGLSKIQTGLPAYRPALVLFYMLHFLFQPTVIVDISEDYETKMQSIQAYHSQFIRTKKSDKKTYINNNFLESIAARAQLYGFQAGCVYGEPFFHNGPIKIDNIIEFFS